MLHHLFLTSPKLLITGFDIGNILGLVPIRIVFVERPCRSLPLLLGRDSADISSITGLNWGTAWLEQTEGYIDLYGLP